MGKIPILAIVEMQNDFAGWVDENEILYKTISEYNDENTEVFKVDENLIGFIFPDLTKLKARFWAKKGQNDVN